VIFADREVRGRGKENKLIDIGFPAFKGYGNEVWTVLNRTLDGFEVFILVNQLVKQN
jgi:hypothetical protein